MWCAGDHQQQAKSLVRGRSDELFKSLKELTAQALKLDEPYQLPSIFLGKSLDKQLVGKGRVRERRIN